MRRRQVVFKAAGRTVRFAARVARRGVSAARKRNEGVVYQAYVPPAKRRKTVQRRVRSSAKPFYCKACGARFSTESAARKHIIAEMNRGLAIERANARREHREAR